MPETQPLSETGIERNITDEIIQEADPLKIDLNDDIFVQVTDARIEDANNWYKKHRDLKSRQQKNKDFLFGRQIEEGELKDYDARYVDNLVYEAEGAIKPIALSRLPDLIVSPGQDTEESKETADQITDVINTDIRKRIHRKVLSLAFRHHPVYFIAAIKYLWDPQKGEHGDYKFEVVHPDNLVLANVPSNDPQDMPFIAQYLRMSVKEVIMRFPDKEAEILNEVKNQGILPKNANKTEKNLATEMTIVEIWFTWYKQAKTPEGETKWERIEGVAWKYGKLLLKKMKNPNWDWEGERRYFKYNEENEEKEPIQEDEIRSAMITGEELNLGEERVFHNHFEQPEKPYIILTYDDWGEMPYDETSRIEQVIRLQENINKRGKQITEMIDRTRGKHIWSTDSGLTQDDIENLDMANPDEDVLVDGDINKVHTAFQGEQPSNSLFVEQEQNRNRLFAKMGVNATTRGEVETDTATTAQLARESDFGKIDDLTEETINFAAEKMANAAMQMIKLRYTEDHFRKILGQDGEVVFTKINRDLIEDGMEVTVSASGVDKILRKREAFERAKLQLTDPLTFFEDTDTPRAKERVKRLWMFFNDPENYALEYAGMRGEETQKNVNRLEEITAQEGGELGGAPSSAEQPEVDNIAAELMNQGGQNPLEGG